jgi:hypothetical protein
MRLGLLAALSAAVLVAATASPAAAATSSSTLPWHCSFAAPAVFGTFATTVSPAARAGEREPAGW